MSNRRIKGERYADRSATTALEDLRDRELVHRKMIMWDLIFRIQDNPMIIRECGSYAVYLAVPTDVTQGSVTKRPKSSLALIR